MEMEKVTYVAVGDSTGEGVGALHGGYPDHLFRWIVDARPSSTLTNLCRSGARSDELLREQLDRGLAAGPNLITLCIGINDIVQGVSVDIFAGYFAEILARIAKTGGLKLVIANMPDIALAPAAIPEISASLKPVIAAYNVEISRTAAYYGGKVVDIWADTHALIPQHPEFFSADGFHPSDLGYEMWAKKMWPTVRQAITVGP